MTLTIKQCQSGLSVFFGRLSMKCLKSVSSLLYADQIKRKPRFDLLLQLYSFAIFSLIAVFTLSLHNICVIINLWKLCNLSVCIKYFSSPLCYTDKINAEICLHRFWKYFWLHKIIWIWCDMKNMFRSNFHFKLKRNLDDESNEEIDDIDDLFSSTYKKRNFMKWKTLLLL